MLVEEALCEFVEFRAKFILQRRCNVGYGSVAVGEVDGNSDWRGENVRYEDDWVMSAAISLQ